jgi:hypothetical protein
MYPLTDMKSNLPQSSRLPETDVLTWVSSFSLSYVKKWPAICEEDLMSCLDSGSGLGREFKCC